MLRTNRSPLFILLLTLPLFAVVACSDSSPDETLEAEAADVREAREAQRGAAEAVADATEQFAQRRKELEAAEEALVAARRDLKAARAIVSDERRELEQAATDTAVFRLVQSRLLEDADLAAAAIMSSVNDGQVTLMGDVDTPGQKAHAEQIAAGTPGVLRVRNLIEVEPDASDSDNPAQR